MPLPYYLSVFEKLARVWVTGSMLFPAGEHANFASALLRSNVSLDYSQKNLVFAVPWLAPFLTQLGLARNVLISAYVLMAI